MDPNGNAEWWRWFLFGFVAVVGAVVGGFLGANCWYNAKALEFTHNAISGKVVLGRSADGYSVIAETKGATYFNTTDKIWDATRAMKGVGDKGMWRINKAFLKQQIKAGKQFYLASNPAVGQNGFFIKEVAYLIKKCIFLRML